MGKILLVDDDPTFRLIAARKLAFEGYACDLASSAKEALEKLYRDHFDLAIIDVRLPDISGVELLKQVKLLDPFFPVIMVSGLKDSSVVKDSLKIGAYDYVFKPVDFEELSAVIRKAIEHHSLLRLKENYQRELERKVKEQAERIRSMYMNYVKGLAKALEAKDPYTRGHSERVAKYSLIIADRLGLSSDLKEKLEFASLLHDIGKIGVKDSILNKPGKLTREEYEYVKKHPVTGVEIVSQVTDDRDILDAIKHHHERWDGKGYPDGLKGVDIPLLARIISVSDTFDAMTSKRAYREPYSVSQTIDEMEKVSWSQLDGDIVDVFKEVEPWKLISKG